MSRLARAWAWWEETWDRREPPEVLALVRIGVGLVLLGDFAEVAAHGLVPALFTSAAHGGLSAATPATSPWVAWVGDDPRAGALLHAGLVLGAAGLAVGFFTRTSAAATMLLSAQWALVLPDADRGIDLLLRNALAILACSAAGDAWSVDAWLRTGTPRGDGAPRPAWPRLLLVLQVVVVYFTAGVQKYGQHWWPWGGWTALYVVLQDWAVAARDFSFLSHPVLYAGTRFATAVTMLWQWSYPLVLLHTFPPPGPPGRFRAAFARWRLHLAWVAVGVLFHFALAATMALGIFPWGMLALYPAFLAPEELPWRGRGASSG